MQAERAAISRSREPFGRPSSRRKARPLSIFAGAIQHLFLVTIPLRRRPVAAALVALAAAPRRVLRAAPSRRAGASPCAARRRCPPISPRSPTPTRNAPKGGTLRLAYLGGFDSLNPYNVKALSTAEGLTGHVFESLMARSRDEPFTLYGLVAADRRNRRRARLRDLPPRTPRRISPTASPITADDVRFTFELLRDHGPPPQRAAFALVKSVTTPDAADDPLRSRRRRRPRIAADPGADAGAVARATPTPRISPTRRWRFPSAPAPISSTASIPAAASSIAATPNYWGRDLPVVARPLQFRPHRDRLFPRRDLAVLRLRRRALRRAHRGRRRPLARATTISRRGGAAKSWSRRSRSACPRACRASPSTPGGHFRRRARARGAGVDVRFRVDQRRPCSAAPTRATRAISTTASSRAPAGRRAPRERALLAPFPGAVRDDILEGRWRPPVSDGSGRDRARARAALAELGVRRLRAEATARLRDARRSAARLRNPRQDPRRGAAGAQPMRRCWRASASPRGCGWSTKPSSSAAASVSIST